MNVACEIFFSIYFFLKKNICLKGSFHSYKLIAMKEDNLQCMMRQSNGSCDIVLTDINMESASLILNCNFIWIFCWPAFMFFKPSNTLHILLTRFIPAICDLFQHMTITAFIWKWMHKRMRLKIWLASYNQGDIQTFKRKFKSMHVSNYTGKCNTRMWLWSC